MSGIIMATSRPERWREFMHVLGEAPGVSTDVVSTGDQVLKAARTKDLLAVVIDQDVSGTSGAGLVRRLLSINAAIHVAWISQLTDEAFHEATEGLGILMKLSPTPNLSEVHDLAARLGKMSGAI